MGKEARSRQKGKSMKKDGAVNSEHRGGTGRDGDKMKDR